MCPTTQRNARTLWNSAALSAVTVPADILSTPTYLGFIPSRNSDFGKGLPQIDPMRHASHQTPSTKNTSSNASLPTSPEILEELNEQNEALEGCVYVSTMDGRVQCFGK
jgi:hypothetical protein